MELHGLLYNVTDTHSQWSHTQLWKHAHTTLYTHPHIQWKDHTFTEATRSPRQWVLIRPLSTNTRQHWPPFEDLLNWFNYTDIWKHTKCLSYLSTSPVSQHIFTFPDATHFALAPSPPFFFYPSLYFQNAQVCFLTCTHTDTQSRMCLLKGCVHVWQGL